MNAALRVQRIFDLDAGVGILPAMPKRGHRTPTVAIIAAMMFTIATALGVGGCDAHSRPTVATEAPETPSGTNASTSPPATVVPSSGTPSVTPTVGITSADPSVASSPIVGLSALNSAYPSAVAAEPAAIQVVRDFFDGMNHEIDTGDELGDAPGHCRIDRSFRRSDQRFWNIACPECGFAQKQFFENFVIDRERPQRSRYQCENCSHEISEVERARRQARRVFAGAGQGHPDGVEDAHASPVQGVLGQVVERQLGHAAAQFARQAGRGIGRRGRGLACGSGSHGVCAPSLLRTGIAVARLKIEYHGILF